MIAKWPEFSEQLVFAEEEKEFERVIDAVRAIRVRRAEMNVPPSKKAKIFIESAYSETFEKTAVFFERLAGASSVEVGSGFSTDGAVSVITEDAKIFIPLDELIDFEAERARLNKERDGVLKDIAFVEAKLNNPGFVEKAPERVVSAQREQLAKSKEKLAMIDERLLSLK